MSNALTFPRFILQKGARVAKIAEQIQSLQHRIDLLDDEDSKLGHELDRDVEEYVEMTNEAEAVTADPGDIYPEYHIGGYSGSDVLPEIHKSYCVMDFDGTVTNVRTKKMAEKIARQVRRNGRAPLMR